MTTISRTILDAFMPEGSLWNPEPDGDFDKLLDAMAENDESVVDFLRSLADVRNPEKTPILEDLEREFGVEPNLALTDAQRRTRLAAVKADKSNDGTAYLLEERLTAAGFDVQVHINSPAVDPADYVLNEWYAVCGNEDAVMGEDTCICGVEKDMLIVNGNRFFYHGDLPSDSGYWHLIFFVGGAVTRDGNGYITDIQPANIDIERTDEFLRLIVKYKPMHAWAGVVANFN